MSSKTDVKSVKTKNINEDAVFLDEKPLPTNSGAFVPHSAINLSVKANEAAAAAAAAAAQSASGIASSSLDLTMSGRKVGFAKVR